MLKFLLIFLLSIIVSINIVLPSKSGPTSVISIQLERTSDNLTVSGDNINPGLFVGMNDVISFGTISPLGIVTDSILSSSRGGSGTNTVTIQSFVIDNDRKLYNVTSNNLPKGNNNGAIYTVSGALQLRSKKDVSGFSDPSDIDVDNSSLSDISVIVAPGTASFNAGSVLPANALILNPDSPYTSLTTALPYNTTFPITVGVHVPFSLTPGVKNATITFRAI